MKPKLAPRLKRVEAPPVMMKTWVLRLWAYGMLTGTYACPTEGEAYNRGEQWADAHPEHSFDVEVISQKRKLR
jgi:hypothetical protein